MRYANACLAIIAAGMFIVGPSRANAQQATPSTVAVPSAEKEEREAKVFYLRNANASDVHQTISMLYNDEKPKEVSIAADLRTNAIIASGESRVIDSIAKLIEILDSNTVAPPVLVVPNQAGTPIKRQLAEELAAITEVELAFDEELGVMMVRSPSEDGVKRFTDTLSQLTEQIAGNDQDEDRETLIRVTWLATKQEGTTDKPVTAPDDTLSGAIERLAAMGYKDLVVDGQLMTRCAIGAASSNVSPKFEVEGRTPDSVEFAARGNVVKRAGSNGANAKYDVEMSVEVTLARTAGNKTEALGSSVSVVVQMTTDAKPIILGSAPVFGRQSFFVVQFLKD